MCLGSQLAMIDGASNARRYAKAGLERKSVLCERTLMLFN